MTPAFSRLAEVGDNQGGNVTVSFGDESREFRNINGVVTMDIPAAAGSLIVRNNASQGLYLSLSTERQPSADELIPAQSNGANVSVRYSGLDGKEVDIASLKQGDEIYADITVVKKDGLGSDSMALTVRVPSGWEIWNERIHNDVQSNARMDIRDDRVCWYFGIGGAEKKSFRIKLRAAYEGTFILPAAIVEDMYRTDCRACTASSMVKFVK